MFTGIIVGTGKITKINKNTKNRSAIQVTINLGKNSSGLKVGQSVAIITKMEKKPKEVKVWFKIPKKLAKYVVQKGSIALDGISLTVVDAKKDLASVCLIPHTIQITNFKNKKVGDKLNIETDVLGKYILN